MSNGLERYRVETALSKEAETIAWIDGWSADCGQPVFYDVGANIGIFSLYAGYKHPGLTVFSFEPTSNNYIRLQQNVWLNKSKNISSFNLALSKTNRISNLYLRDLRPGNSGAQIDHAVDETGCEYEVQRVERVLSLSLDRLVFDYGFPLPTYVKIDVDGNEIEILEGMSRALRESRMKSILIEFNDENKFFGWSGRLEKLGFFLDLRYENLPNHSRIRRQASGQGARNYIFTRSA